MSFENKISILEQELRRVKKELSEREQDLSIYKEEIKRLNFLVSEILSGMDRDLSLIKDIFKYLIPTQFPHISGFNFSTKFISGMRFNGDYLDVFEQKTKFKFNLIMSSSAGPSLTALLIAFLLKYGRDLNGVGSKPSSFIEKVIEEIKNKGEQVSDLQIACLMVDKKKYEFTYKIHGGVKCFFQSKENNRVRELTSASDEPMGLSPFDRVVLLSPGMISATNSKGQSFGTTPILQALSEVGLNQNVHDLRNEIFFKLDRHLDGRKPMQDVSLIVMSVENNILKLV